MTNSPRRLALAVPRVWPPARSLICAPGSARPAMIAEPSRSTRTTSKLGTMGPPAGLAGEGSGADGIGDFAATLVSSPAPEAGGDTGGFAGTATALLRSAFVWSVAFLGATSSVTASRTRAISPLGPTSSVLLPVDGATSLATRSSGLEGATCGFLSSPPATRSRTVSMAFARGLKGGGVWFSACGDPDPGAAVLPVAGWAAFSASPPPVSSDATVSIAFSAIEGVSAGPVLGSFAARAGTAASGVGATPGASAGFLARAVTFLVSETGGAGGSATIGPAASAPSTFAT